MRELRKFDISNIRQDFPILQRTVHGRPLIYFDNAASAQKPRAVIESITNQMSRSYANVHRGLHTLANETTQAYEAARTRVAAFLNAQSAEEIVFTRGSTEAINLVASSYGRLAIGEGDEIVLSVLEHHSNIVPWHFLRERMGARLRWVDIDDDGRIDPASVARELTHRTRIIAITHMSNVLGGIVGIQEIARLAHDVGAKVLVDGSQAAVHGPVDVQDLGCDFYVFTGHKIYGPTGIGVLWARRQLLDAMPPYQGGGEMIETVSREKITYALAPQKFEAGTPPILEAIGLHAALDYLGGFERGDLMAHEAILLKSAESALAEIKGVRCYGSVAAKGPILAFAVDGAHAHDVATVLDQLGIAVRAGAHCAEPLMHRLGLSSTVRASFGIYNTVEEVEEFSRAVERATSILR